MYVTTQKVAQHSLSLEAVLRSGHGGAFWLQVSKRAPKNISIDGPTTAQSSFI
jgi:hypothetical protein